MIVIGIIVLAARIAIFIFLVDIDPQSPQDILMQFRSREYNVRVLKLPVVQFVFEVIGQGEFAWANYLFVC